MKTPTPSIQRVGLVDDRLDNFHADIYLETLRGALASRGVAVAGATALQRAPSVQWAEKNDVPFYEDVRTLNEHVDAFMVLAPSTPEVHLELCRRVFPLSKPTYVDKTFAPDLATAQQIFALADEHGVAVQTASALRYTQVQKEVLALEQPVRHLTVWAGGTTFEEYGIHPVELAVSCMGPGALAVMSVGDARHPQIVIRFTHGRTATINFNVGMHVPYAAAITTAQETRHITVDDSRLFIDTASAILDFLEAGTPQIERAETLTIRAILDVCNGSELRSRFVPLVSSPAAGLPGPVEVSL